jgi:hypothetical protein
MTTTRSSVVGSSTSIICMAASFSSTALGVMPGPRVFSRCLQRDQQTIGQKRNENMGFNSNFDLVIDGTDRQIVLQLLERLLDLDQLVTDAVRCCLDYYE